MDAIALHLELRNALSLADELGRHEHALGHHELTAQLNATRTLLDSLERDAGRSHARPMTPSPAVVAQLQRALDVIRDRSEEFPLVLRPRMVLLVEALERIAFAERTAPVSATPYRAAGVGIGLALAAAPLVFGYAAKRPLFATLQVIAGLGAVSFALFGHPGLSRPLRSKGGPTPTRDRLPSQVQNRVPEVQRPLEGLAGNSYIEPAEL